KKNVGKPDRRVTEQTDTKVKKRINNIKEILENKKEKLTINDEIDKIKDSLDYQIKQLKNVWKYYDSNKIMSNELNKEMNKVAEQSKSEQDCEDEMQIKCEQDYANKVVSKIMQIKCEQDFEDEMQIKCEQDNKQDNEENIEQLKVQIKICDVEETIYELEEKLEEKMRLKTKINMLKRT
ncbi:3293_t:CDS:2, partial [Gigaspora margarita]